MATVLALLTLVTAQDFIFANHDSPAALLNWWIDASFHITNIELVTEILRGHLPSGNPGEDGGASGFYHFLGYVPAALGCALLSLSPIKSYALIYAPLSVFLFALGLWLMAAACWSRERALWATVVFMLLPDSLPYLGSSHEFLRLKWLVSVSPGLGYGVFVCAVAWVLTLRGIREARLGYVAAGWLACVLTVLVKAHLFVANVLPLVVYTIACYPRLTKPLRGKLLMLFLAAYALATWEAGKFLGVPLIRLDFSHAATYAATLANIQPLDAMSTGLLRGVSGLSPVAAPFALAFSLLYLHFGLLLSSTLFFVLHRDADTGKGSNWLPPLAIFGVYLLHAVGLAQDTRPYEYSGESIELIHRPFVWGVSLMVVWVLSSLATNCPKALSCGRRWALVLLLLPVAIHSYHGLQFAPRWPAPRIDYSDDDFAALRFVGDRATRGELVQAADLDPFLVVQAVTGRTPYAVRYAMRAHPSSSALSRSAELGRWLRETDPARVTAFAERNGISWLFVRDVRGLGWPPEFIDQHTQFRRNGVAVLRFMRPSRETSRGL